MLCCMCKCAEIPIFSQVNNALMLRYQMLLMMQFPSFERIDADFISFDHAKTSR